MMTIKMIGLDLDGTLLNSRKEITAYTKRVLVEAVERGITVLAATGRPLAGMPGEVLELPGMRYALTANGARIMDVRKGRILWESLVPVELSKKVVGILEDYDTLLEICYDGVSFAQEDELQKVSHYIADSHMAEYVLSTRTPVLDLWDKIKSMNGRGMDKVQGVFKDQAEKERAAERIRALGNLSVSGALGNNLEINAPGVNKGEGLLKLGEMLGISREEIMACGDGNNDLDMIKAVGLGVAMGNAIPEIKKAAEYITGTNDEDGAAAAIERFALAGQCCGRSSEGHIPE